MVKLEGNKFPVSPYYDIVYSIAAVSFPSFLRTTSREREEIMTLHKKREDKGKDGVN